MRALQLGSLVYRVIADASAMVSGMQERDSHGYPKMAALLKHFTAYSTETNRGHDSYNISTFDFFDSYLPAYKAAFQQGNASGAMCSYNAENGHPSFANGWLLNEVLRKRWGKPDALITTDCGAVTDVGVRSPGEGGSAFCRGSFVRTSSWRP